MINVFVCIILYYRYISFRTISHFSALLLTDFSLFFDHHRSTYSKIIVLLFTEKDYIYLLGIGPASDIFISFVLSVRTRLKLPQRNCNMWQSSTYYGAHSMGLLLCGTTEISAREIASKKQFFHVLQLHRCSHTHMLSSIFRRAIRKIETNGHALFFVCSRFISRYSIRNIQKPFCRLWSF